MNAIFGKLNTINIMAAKQNMDLIFIQPDILNVVVFALSKFKLQLFMQEIALKTPEVHLQMTKKKTFFLNSEKHEFFSLHVQIWKCCKMLAKCCADTCLCVRDL